MKFVSAFLLPFRFWQILSLAPFGLIENSLSFNVNKKDKIFAIFSLFMHITWLIISVTFMDSYLLPSHSRVYVIDTVFIMLFNHFTSCFIIAEAIINTNHQIDFLERMNKIDYALTYKLQIKIIHEKYTFQNNVRFICWILWHLICHLTIIAYFAIAASIEFNFWIFYAIPFFICSLQYQRMILYIHQIRNRYAILNKFIIDNFPSYIVSIYEPNKVNEKKIDLLKSKTLLRELRDTYQELHDVSELINKIFRWSLPLCIGHDFHSILTNFYLVLSVWMKHDSWTHVTPSIMWLTCSLSQVWLLSHACHSTTAEVNIYSSYK